jgi:hypothetical protein
MAKHFVENFTSIFFTPTFDVHIDEAGAHKDIRLNHFIRSMYECVCLLAVFPTLYML